MQHFCYTNSSKKTSQSSIHIHNNHKFQIIRHKLKLYESQWKLSSNNVHIPVMGYTSR